MLKPARPPARLLTVVAACAGTCGVLLVFCAGLVSSWERWLLSGIGATLTGAAVWIPFAMQAKLARLRLRVALRAEAEPICIPRFTPNDAVEEWLQREQARCLASLRPLRAAKSPEIPTSPPLKPPSVRDLDVTFKEALQLSALQQAGGLLSADQVSRLEQAQAALNGVAEAFVGAVGEPDRRTEEAYRKEVECYLTECRDALRKAERVLYASEGLGLIQLVLVNPTEHTFHDVEVQLYLPGDIRAFADKPPRRRVRMPSVPERPRPFGQREPSWEFAHSTELIGLRSTPLVPSVPTLHIDNSGSARLTFPPVLLRSGSKVMLDRVHLLTTEPESSTVRGTWEATATDADGPYRGSLDIHVRGTADLTEGLIAHLRSLDGDDF